MTGVKVGFALCGSYCTFEKVFHEMARLKAGGAEVQPIFSENVYSTDTRFGSAREFIWAAEDICGKPIWHTMTQTEPIGPRGLLDVLVVAPCTGNTLGKLASGVTDTCVTMACKAHLRNNRPLVLAVSTNDGLAAAARNIGELLARKNIYFVPFGQDDALHKPASLVADMRLILPAAEESLCGRQVQPLLVPSGSAQSSSL